jgi:hypothetical protein
MPPSSNNLTLHSIHLQTFKKNNKTMQIIQIDDHELHLARSCSLASWKLRSGTTSGRCAEVPSGGGFAFPASPLSLRLPLRAPRAFPFFINKKKLSYFVLLNLNQKELSSWVRS